MVQQCKALAIGSSDIDTRHLGEDFNNAAGTGTCRDGRMQGRVRVSILKQRALVTQGCLCPRSSCFLDLGLVSRERPGLSLTGKLTSQPRSHKVFTTSRKPLCTATCRAVLRVPFRASTPHPALRSTLVASGWFLREEMGGFGVTLLRAHWL